MIKEKSSKMISLVLIDSFRTILYFPLWWYSRGLVNTLKGSLSWTRDFEQTLGFKIWVKNLFVPMFGQRDIMGRFISFLLRLFQIITKGIVLLVFIFLQIVLIVFWLVLPVFILYMIIMHI